MISGPRGELQHTGHIGLDGAFFGDVGFIGSAKAVAAASSERFKSASLLRADSDASERAPLLSTGGGAARDSTSGAAPMGHWSRHWLPAPGWIALCSASS